VTRILQQRRGEIQQVQQRLAPRIERVAHAGGLPAAPRRLSRTKMFACGDELIERVAVVPVKLVDGPRRD
jgi:hypothetical protein